MAIKEAEVHVTEDTAACPACGHPHLCGATRREGEVQVWFAYCPSCQEVLESASIPDWFTLGLTGPGGSDRLH